MTFVTWLPDISLLRSGGTCLFWHLLCPLWQLLFTYCFGVSVPDEKKNCLHMEKVYDELWDSWTGTLKNKLSPLAEIHLKASTFKPASPLRFN